MSDDERHHSHERGDVSPPLDYTGDVPAGAVTEHTPQLPSGEIVQAESTSRHQLHRELTRRLSLGFALTSLGSTFGKKFVLVDRFACLTLT